MNRKGAERITIIKNPYRRKGTRRMPEQINTGGVSRRDFLRGAATVGLGATALATLSACDTTAPGAEDGEGGTSESWDYEADVVVVGAGSGLLAALKAADEGASVLIVDANWEVGGHMAICGANLHSGAGTAIQKQYGIEDSPNQYYLDHTTWRTLVSRYNIRDVVRSTADNMVEAFDFLLDNGVKIVDQAPGNIMGPSYLAGGTNPETVNRDTRGDQETEGWASILSGEDVADPIFGRGVSISRPLERTVREKNIPILLNYHMDTIIREQPLTGRIIGIEASYTPTILPGETEPLASMWTDGNVEEIREKIRIKANRGVIVATGGYLGNVQFRETFDPRLGPEFDGAAGDPFTIQDASGVIASQAVGASLGALANQVQPTGMQMTAVGFIGCQYGFGNAPWKETSPIFKLVRATGLRIRDYKDVILVNLLGQRFYNEDDARGYEFFAAAMGNAIVNPDSPNCRRVGGPVWAIFDADALERHQWVAEPPFVDIEDGRVFSGATIEELASNIVNKYYEDIKMDPVVLAETIRAYNGYVDAGTDAEFGKTSLEFKIEKGPFYAAWAVPNLCDSLSGLRVDGAQTVIDIFGEPIPNLFACGECTAGLAVHGLGRVLTAAYIAGESAAHA
jgi:succinate dehydrogenase/fumarate reductase flavoprotein subunit